MEQGMADEGKLKCRAGSKCRTGPEQTGYRIEQNRQFRQVKTRTMI